MKKPLIFAAVGASLAAGVAFAVGGAARPSAPRMVPVGARASPVPPQAIAPPAPGLYSAKPYAGLVLVPKELDPAIAVVPPASALSDECVVNPHVELEPKR